MDVEQRVGVEADVEPLGDEPRQRDLVPAAHGLEALAERRVVGKGRQRLEPPGVVEELRADGVDDELGQPRVRLEQPAAERDPVGLVDDAVRIDRMQVAEHRLPHELVCSADTPLTRREPRNAR